MPASMLPLLIALSAAALAAVQPHPRAHPGPAAATSTAAAVGSAAPVGGATPARAVAAASAPRLVPNERMEFAIDYKGVRLGKADMFLGHAEGAVIPAFLQTRTTGLAAFITIRQQLSSNLDRETGLPRSLSLEAVEGSYRHVDTTAFDRIANTATVRERGKYDNTYVVDVPPGTTDFLGLVFRLRELPLDSGERLPFDVITGRTVSRVQAEVTGRETVSTALGDFPAVKVQVPTSFEGKFQEKNPTFIWFSDDARRIVVRISTDFAIGRATATLVSYTPGTPASAEQ